MKVEVVPAELKHYHDLARFLWDLEGETAQRKARKLPLKLEVNPETVIMFFEGAVNNPMGQIYFPLLYIEDQLAGFAVVQEQIRPKLVGARVEPEPFSFIWALYKVPTIQDREGNVAKVLGVGNSELKESVVSWGRSRGHIHLLGSCLPNFKTRAAAMWGFRVMQITVGMDL